MSFETNKWVRVMCDYAADGVWDDEGISCWPEDLPLPAGLVARIRKWQEWYERDCTDYLPENGLDIVSFSLEGLEIARAVKAVLPDWTVIYFDEAKLKEHLDRDHGRRDSAEDRSFFEYEITLPSEEVLHTP